MNKFKEEIINTKFTEFYSSDFGRCVYSKVLKIGICESLDQYIHVDQVMTIFKKCGEMIKNYDLKYFIFDKRALRAFHQPSMEWYYIEWKQDMLKLGLKDHFKILPNEEWFNKCVEAGRAEIARDYPESLLDQINVTYVNSIQEAIDQIQS